MSESNNTIGKDNHTTKQKRLQEALTDLNVTYDKWLSSRINIHTGLSPDLLSNHFRTYSNEAGVQFYIKNTLPPDIRNACIFAFNTIFRTN
jgi:hypothetical protein